MDEKGSSKAENSQKAKKSDESLKRKIARRPVENDLLGGKNKEVTMREIHKLGHLSVTFRLQMDKQIRMKMYLIPMQSMFGIKFCSVNLKRR